MNTPAREQVTQVVTPSTEAVTVGSLEQVGALQGHGGRIYLQDARIAAGARETWLLDVLLESSTVGQEEGRSTGPTSRAAGEHRAKSLPCRTAGGRGE